MTDHRFPTIDDEVLLSLTDEELAVVAGTDGFAVFPFLGGLDEEQDSLARSVAFRSLVARGIIEPPSAQEEGEAMAAAERSGSAKVDLPIRLPEGLADLLAFRVAPEAAVCVSRTTSLGQDFRYAYAVGEELLVEEVSEEGIHVFRLADRDALVELAAGWAVHPEARRGPASVLDVPVAGGDTISPPQEVIEALGEALLRADVVVWRGLGDESPVLLGVFSGPAATWLGSIEYGTGQSVQMFSVAPTAVTAEIEGLLRRT